MLTENEAEYVNAREAARLLGVSQRAVRNLAGQQRLEVKTEGGGAAMRFMVSSWPPYEGSARSGNGKRTGAGAKKLASTHLVALRVGGHRRGTSMRGPSEERKWKSLWL